MCLGQNRRKQKKQKCLGKERGNRQENEKSVLTGVGQRDQKQQRREQDPAGRKIDKERETTLLRDLKEYKTSSKEKEREMCHEGLGRKRNERFCGPEKGNYGGRLQFAVQDDRGGEQAGSLGPGRAEINLDPKREAAAGEEKGGAKGKRLW